MNLNLQLMKWRMYPSLDVDMLGKLKCLLVGSGTLGCQVARDLLVILATLNQFNSLKGMGNY